MAEAHRCKLRALWVSCVLPFGGRALGSQRSSEGSKDEVWKLRKPEGIYILGSVASGVQRCPFSSRGRLFIPSLGVINWYSAYIHSVQVFCSLPSK